MYIYIYIYQNHLTQTVSWYCWDITEGSTIKVDNQCLLLEIRLSFRPFVRPPSRAPVVTAVRPSSTRPSVKLSVCPCSNFSVRPCVRASAP